MRNAAAITIPMPLAVPGVRDLRLEGVKAKGKRVKPLIGEKGEDRDRGQRWPDERKHDVPVDAKKTAAIEPGGVPQVARHALEK